MAQDCNNPYNKNPPTQYSGSGGSLSNNPFTQDLVTQSSGSGGYSSNNPYTYLARSSGSGGSSFCKPDPERPIQVGNLPQSNPTSTEQASALQLVLYPFSLHDEKLHRKYQEDWLAFEPDEPSFDPFEKGNPPKRSWALPGMFRKKQKKTELRSTAPIRHRAITRRFGVYGIQIRRRGSIEAAQP